VQVAAYNPHLGLPRSERCKVGHRTVYSDRREADVVMTSEVSEHSTIPHDTPGDVAHNTRCTAANSLGLRPLDGEPASGRMSYVSGQARKRAERSHLAEKPSSCRCASHSTGKWVRKFSSVILTGCRPSKILSTISGARKAH